MRVQDRVGREPGERTRDAAAEQRARNDPIDVSAPRMQAEGEQFGRHGIEQIGPDGEARLHAQHEHEERNQERSAADAGEADEGADDEADERDLEIELHDDVGKGSV